MVVVVSVVAIELLVVATAHDDEADALHEVPGPAYGVDQAAARDVAAENCAVSSAVRPPDTAGRVRGLHWGPYRAQSRLHDSPSPHQETLCLFRDRSEQRHQVHRGQDPPL